MATEILSAGYDGVNHTHTAATTAKTFLLINSLPVMPMNSALANVENYFVDQADRIRVPKATGEAWTPLTKIYWDDTAKKFTTTSTSNTLAGYVKEPALSADIEGVIRLDPLAVNA